MKINGTLLDYKSSESLAVLKPCDDLGTNNQNAVTIWRELSKEWICSDNNH